MPVDLKVKNRTAVLAAFRDGREYTASEVANVTGISRQTVMKAIQFFIDKGLLGNTGKGASTEAGGKKPDLYSLVVSSLLLSITMWPDNLILTLSDMQGKRIGQIRVNTAIADTPDEAFNRLRQYSLRLLEEHGYTISDLYGVSLSTSGIIDYKKGLLRFNSQLPGWGTNVPVQQYLREIFDENVVIVVENAGKMTGRAALFGEQYADKRIVVIFSTWGLSACFIEKSHILSGLNSLIGEIGHMTIDPHDEDVCGCGCRGCLERLVSIEHIRREIAANPKQHAASILSGIDTNAVTLPDLFHASEQEDGFACVIVARIAEYFSIALHNITLSFDPDLVVFQGIYSGAGSFFEKKVKEYLAAFQYSPSDGPFEMWFDQRSLFDLDVIGSQNYLQDLFFQDSSLYQHRAKQVKSSTKPEAAHST